MFCKNNYLINMQRQWNFLRKRGRAWKPACSHAAGRAGFFGSIRGHRRIGKTALIQQAIKILAEGRDKRLPGASRTTARQQSIGFHDGISKRRYGKRGLENRVGGADSIQDLAGIAAAVGRPSADRGVTVVLRDEIPDLPSRTVVRFPVPTPGASGPPPEREHCRRTDSAGFRAD